MIYLGMPLGMWLLFKRSFRRGLVTVLDFEPAAAQAVTSRAKQKYRQIIDRLPAYERGDRFQMNIVSCAMLTAFLLNMNPKPTVEQLTEYYSISMMTVPTKWFCRLSGKRKFSEKDVAGMRATAAFKAADRNPYSWNMEFLPYSDGSGYEARFSKCGICTLMREYGLFKYVSAMCHLDYDMSEAGGTDTFVRKYTLASGGPYCDCGYRKKQIAEE